jgi:CDP-4-dehydro-6-deoxyglucose reductase/ferredoxin-NAD(P)+ reductase (naphthalene dioxygenase ferredoxin-specific)
MAHTLRIAGDPQAIPVEDGETILEALQRHGVGFAYSCQAGNCGTCKCEYVSGEILELEYSEHALPASDRARGIILACRTQAWGDLEIRRLDGEDFVMHPSRVMQCRVVEMVPLTHDILGLRLRIEHGGPFTFSAGQFAKLEFPFAPEHPRDYSMANSPADELLEFQLRTIPGGISGQIPSRLEVGDLVRVCGPFGTSYLRDRHAGPMLAIAGGSGLAPIRSIVRQALAQRCSSPIHLYFGVRAERDVYGQRELAQLSEQHPNLRVHIVLSEERSAARRHGLISEAVAADFADLTGFKVYLAGPPAMVDAATDVARSRGVPARDIHADAFYPAVEPSVRSRAVA